MKKRRRLFGTLLIAAALIIMGLPVSEADAATSASDFVMQGSTLVRYTGTEKNVSVPSDVEVIGKSAFEDNGNVELVVLPNSVERIEAYAFWGCDNLDTVVLGRGLTGIGDYAFAGCGGLKQMSIPANILSIGVQAFGDCVNMTDITIPAETSYIQETAFDGCARLTIHCDEGTAAYTYAQAFYERQKEMPEYEDVPNYQPDDSGQGDVPETAPSPTPEPVPTAQPVSTEGETIGSTSIVGNQAFVFLNSGEMNVLEPKVVPTPSDPPVVQDVQGLLADMTTAGTAPKIPKYAVVDGRIVADQAFYRNGSLEEVVLREGITEIGQFAFARSSLRKIEIPEGVTDICYGAFYHCDGLESVVLPETVVNVEPKAFNFTAMMDRFIEGGTDFLVNGGVLLAYNGSSSQVFVPGGIRVIAAEVFAGHTEIEGIRLPDSVKVVGEAAFEGCSGLRQVDLGSGVEQIRDRAFADCGGLESLEIPASVRTVGQRSFGDAKVRYAGEAPEKTYDTSAARLSNEQYREVGQEQTEPGVTVVGANPSAARLEGAARSYTLRVEQEADRTKLEGAWRRALMSEAPENLAVYDLQLTDSSGIPLTKLGRSGLDVVLPLPEELWGQELKLITLDRNGQLETAEVERVILEGTECFRFRTTQLSQFGVYGVGEAEVQANEVSLYKNAGPGGTGQKAGGSVGFAVKLMLGAAMLTFGLLLAASGGNKRSACTEI